MRTRRQVAETIDHAILKPTALVADVVSGCRMAREFGVASVCVRPTDVSIAKRELDGSEVEVSTVVGFPHGCNLPEVKAQETRLALKEGAREVDMVMNIGQFLSAQHDYVRDDIAAVVSEARKQAALVKVILETYYLSPEQIATACMLAKSAEADYVKTSTGFADGAATAEAVDIMVATVGDCMGVKASGGIRDTASLLAFLDRGCQRVGISATQTILESIPEGSDAAS